MGLQHRGRLKGKAPAGSPRAEQISQRCDIVILFENQISTGHDRKNEPVGCSTDEFQEGNHPSDPYGSDG